MSDALKKLLENDAVSAQVRSEIEEAWNNRVNENRKRVTAELREEFAQKYEHDKKIMTEAIDKMVSERLASEIAEFNEDRKQLAAAKVRYAKAIKENSDVLKKFITQQLKKEISELHEDQKQSKRKYKQLENFVVESLAKEITEFDIDRRDLVETKVKLVKGAKKEFNKLKENFIKRSAKTVSSTVSSALNKELYQLREDIEQARKNDFGRKLFEAFSNEYASSYINEKSEIGKLMKLVKTQEKQLTEQKQKMNKAIKLAEAQMKQNRHIITESKRKNAIDELVNPLNPKQQRIMRDLLETVQHDRLQSAFDRYLPTVIDGNSNTGSTKKSTLTESKSVTGNRDYVANKNNDDNVYDLRRLAGL